MPGDGGKFCCGAGVSGIVFRKFKGNLSEDFVGVQLPSGKKVYLNSMCMATIGVSSNVRNKLLIKGNAGVNRRLGFRSKIRGVAKNPIDHPHGGGEGKTSGGRISVSAWGFLTKGYKTKKYKILKRFYTSFKRVNKLGTILF